MARGRYREKTMTGKIFENILFLAEAFGDNAHRDIPDVPVLELARSFELSHPRVARNGRRHRKQWALWK